MTDLQKLIKEEFPTESGMIHVMEDDLVAFILHTVEQEKQELREKLHRMKRGELIDHSKPYPIGMDNPDRLKWRYDAGYNRAIDDILALLS